MATKTNVVVKVNDGLQYIMQPNQVTYMRYDYPAVLNKAFANIIEALQKNITNSFKQLTLFEGDSDITLEFPINSFGVDRKHYDHLRKSLVMLSLIPIQVPVVDKDGKKYRMYSGLCKVYFPDEKYSTKVFVKIDNQVARHLISVKDGYTKYLKEIVYKNKNKYSQRLYVLLSAWKSRDSVNISIEKLKSLFNVTDKYKKNSDFERFILKPAKKDLWEKADIWFDYVIQDKNVVFFLYTSFFDEKDFEKNKTVRTSITNLINRYYKLSPTQVDEIVKLVNIDNYESVMIELTEIQNYINDNKNKVFNPDSYFYRTMLNFFAEYKTDSIPIDIP